MPDTTTQPWKVGDPALIETWGPQGSTGQWYKTTIARIDPVGPYYHLHGPQCYDHQIVRSARELKRPTPTEPATEDDRMRADEERCLIDRLLAERSTLTNIELTFIEDLDRYTAGRRRPLSTCGGTRLRRLADKMAQSTEPATCHKITRMVGIHVRVEPPSDIGAFIGHPMDPDILTRWAVDFQIFVRNHRDQSETQTSIERDEQDQCSACGKEWKPRIIDGGLRCRHCTTLARPIEPTP